jgi:hypothetical protein
MRKSTTNKEQRSEIAGALRETVGTTALGKSHAASFAEVVDDLSSGDPEANPAFPYASDGLLYNFVSGTASATTNSSITVLVAEFSPPLIVTIEVPSDTQIIGPMKLNGRLAEIKVGDRVNVGTSFLSQGLRYARWINVNQLSGWSELLDLEPLTLETSPFGRYSASNRAPAFSLALESGTTIVSSDGTMVSGDPSNLQVGDVIYWTAFSESPAFLTSRATAIFVRAQLRTVQP